MARMPGAVWRPMPGSSTTPMAAYDVLCFHTMVGSLAGTDAYFRSSASGTNSHFGVGGDGTIYQWVDTAYRSGASYNGNYHLISVETADMGAEFAPWSGSDVPAWTAAQVEANAKIAAWVHAEHGTPLVQIPDAMKTRRGVGYHRLGVPGYMVAGAEQWSTVNKKSCPGDQRIAQVPSVVARAKQGDAPPVPLAVTESDMYLAATPDKTVWKITDYDVSAEPGIYRMGALSKARGSLPIVQITQEELNDNIADADARRGRLLADIAKAAGGEVDESAIVAALLPAITTALAGKVGASAQEIAELLKGITLHAS